MGKAEKEYGSDLKARREAVGVSRTQLALALDLSEHTLRQVESGYQAMGARSKALADKVLSGENGTRARKPVSYLDDDPDVGWLELHEDDVRKVIRTCMDDDFVSKCKKISDLLAIAMDQAALVVIKETGVLAKQDGDGGTS